MILCTQLPTEERCNGCPLNDFRQLEPHEELAATTNLAILLGGQDENATKESYVRAVGDTYDRIERAAGKVSHLVRNIANWRMVGACEYHEGPVLEMEPEQEEKLKKFIASLSKGE